MKNNEKQILDGIEKVRAKNNKNWMNIIRLAMEKAPEEAKQIMTAISEEDKKITVLVQELAGIKKWKKKRRILNENNQK